MRWPYLAGRNLTPPPPPAPPEPEWVPRGEQRLDDKVVERLALALHERRHGDHVSDGGKVRCARLSGAFDDIWAIEPLIVDLMGGA